MAHRPSSIDQLPKEIKEIIGQLRLQGRTIDEILAHLDQLNTEVSRSALGRHVKKLAVLGERMRQSRDMASALVQKFGSEPDDKVARLNLEMMHSIILDVMTAQTVDDDGDPMPVQLDAEQASYLARALKDLASAQKTDSDRTLKMRQELAKEMAKKVEAVTTANGVSKDVANLIFDAMLGEKA